MVGLPRFRRRDPDPPANPAGSSPSASPSAPRPRRAGAFEPVPAPGGAGRKTDEVPPSRPTPAARKPPLRLCGRFRTASRALAYVANLVAAHRDDKAQYYSGRKCWWVIAELELDLGRTAVQAAGGLTYVDIDGKLAWDKGWGSPPQSHDDRSVPLSELAETTLLDLIRSAGLRPEPPRQLSEASIILPGSVATPVIRRALDLELTVHYRPVRLTPLFSPENGESTTLIQVDLRAEPGPIPATLLSAVAELPLTLVTRRVGDGPRLLVQQRMASALGDDGLAAVTNGETWVLADAGFGCWRLEGWGDLLPGATLVRTDHDTALVDQPPAGNHERIAPVTVRLIPAHHAGQRVDAMLLDDGDLGNLALLIRGHPLADVALLVRGRDRHLVTAPGGLLETLPAGEPLVCIGPHLLYLPLGYRLAPRLPQSARQQLFAPDSDHAIVLHPHGAWRFGVGDAVPIWHLWADLSPVIEDQLPARIGKALEMLEPQPLVQQPRRGAWPQPERARAAGDAWRAEAWALEREGQFAKAAVLYRRNRDPLRAAQLYERAAQLDQPEGRR